jgi:hypothetical protein
LCQFHCKKLHKIFPFPPQLLILRSPNRIKKTPPLPSPRDDLGSSVGLTIGTAFSAHVKQQWMNQSINQIQIVLIWSPKIYTKWWIGSEEDFTLQRTTNDYYYWLNISFTCKRGIIKLRGIHLLFVLPIFLFWAYKWRLIHNLHIYIIMTSDHSELFFSVIALQSWKSRSYFHRFLRGLIKYESRVCI